MFNVSRKCSITVYWLLTLSSCFSGFIFSGTFCSLDFCSIDLFNRVVQFVQWQVLSCSINQWLLNKSLFQYVYFSIELCIFTVLDEDCHILYAFCLNSKMCSHISDAHSSSGQATYDLRMDAYLCISFLRIISF